MEYYHSMTITSPTIKKLPSNPTITGHSSTETGKSTTATKKVSNDIHSFLAEQEQEFFRIPSSLPAIPKKEREHKPKTFSVDQIQAENTKNYQRRNSQRKDLTPKKSTENISNKETKYAGGGYEKSPNPKQLSKPTFVSPAKKDKRPSESKMTEISSTKAQSLQQKFAHNLHSQSVPNLNGMQVPYTSHSMIPMPQMSPISPMFVPNFNGQMFVNETSFYPVPTMTREEANRDLRTKLNIL